MQFKRTRINRFVDEELPQFIEERIKHLDPSKKKELKSAIFRAIIEFFSRYYQKGDLFQNRRYASDHKFMIPFNGQETLLHWVHKDYYYIKSHEDYQHFSFCINDFTIHLHLSKREADQDTEQIREYFITLRKKDPLKYDFSTKTLEIYLIKEPITENLGQKQPETNQETQLLQLSNAILNSISDSSLLNTLKRGESKQNQSSLTKYLQIFIQRNTADFFIHRNLHQFLTNELDYYIKHELISLDTLFKISQTNQLMQIQIIHAICGQIIQLLSQIEAFQKELWEKKPFVVKTEYCFTLNRVPDEFLQQILANQAQIHQWCREYRLDESLFSTLNASLKLDRKPTQPLSRETFKEKLAPFCNFEYLVLDTKFFPAEFTQKLLNSFEDLDLVIDGLCIKSENWRALNFLSQKYTHQIKCIYIDPPYNTGANDFIYKDNYPHSSWLTMMANRLELAKDLLQEEGLFFSSIDDHEQPYLNQLIETIFGYKMDNIVWHKKTQPSFLSKEIINVTEYIIPAKITPNIVPMVGGFGDKEKHAELINQSNEMCSRSLPKDNVIFGNQWSGSLDAGDYGKGILKIRLVEPLIIHDGIANQEIKLIGRFKWTQQKILDEISKGGQIFIKSIKSLRPTMKRVFDSDIIKAPITLLSKKINEIPTNTDATNELKDLFGIDTFKVIEAETPQQGNIHVKTTGLEKDFKYSNFSSGNF